MGILKEVCIITSDEILQSLKSKKAILMIVAYLLLMYLGLKLGSFLEILSIFFTESRRAFSLYLPYYISMFLLPMFSVFISYDAISEEKHSKSIKYLVGRANRASVIVGKYMGAIALSTTIIFVAYVMATIYLYFKLKEVMIYSSFISWFYMSLYAACIISICVLVSTMTKNPNSSLNFSIVALVLSLIVLNPLWPAWLTSISPLYYAKDALGFLSNGESLARGILALGGYIIVCISAAIIYFRRCDL